MSFADINNTRNFHEDRSVTYILYINLLDGFLVATSGVFPRKYYYLVIGHSVYKY